MFRCACSSRTRADSLMPRRRGDGHRMVRWLWTSRAPAARICRACLLPASFLWDSVMGVRRWAYRRGLLAVRTLPLPSVAVGNLSVGGSGKTPVAAWIASHFAGQGLRPAILLRGVGGD